MKERYVVSAPLGGRLQRITLESGDPVTAGETLLATIEPRAPELLDPRERAEIEPRVSAAKAATERARAQLERAKADAELARSEFERAKKLVRRGVISRRDLDDASHRAAVTTEAVKSARAAVRVAEFELQQAEAAYTRTAPGMSAGSENWNVPIYSAIDGRVLRVLQESAAVVRPGDQLLELGDPSDLEVWIDALTTDAVKVKPGVPVLLDHWGGDAPLHALVRRIEPAGFTKISALGVEEKRAWIIADFTDPHEKWAKLGDNYRVEARIVIWKKDEVLKIPAGALFRHVAGWAVFRVTGGEAELHPVRIGHDNGLEAEVLDGLAPGDPVIVHPSDKISDGVRVARR
ncbi:MAG: efflux RND transporter periplasmic adaptor subunit [Gammaproteobacteria bacterium]